MHYQQDNSCYNFIHSSLQNFREGLIDKYNTNYEQQSAGYLAKARIDNKVDQLRTQIRSVSRLINHASALAHNGINQRKEQQASHRDYLLATRGKRGQFKHRVKTDSFELGFNRNILIEDNHEQGGSEDERQRLLLEQDQYFSDNYQVQFKEFEPDSTTRKRLPIFASTVSPRSQRWPQTTKHMPTQNFFKRPGSPNGFIANDISKSYRTEQLLKEAKVNLQYLPTNFQSRQDKPGYSSMNRYKLLRHTKMFDEGLKQSSSMQKRDGSQSGPRKKIIIKRCIAQPTDKAMKHRSSFQAQVRNILVSPENHLTGSRQRSKPRYFLKQNVIDRLEATSSRERIQEREQFKKHIVRYNFVKRYLSEMQMDELYDYLKKSSIPSHKWPLFVVDTVYNKIKKQHCTKPAR